MKRYVSYLPVIYKDKYISISKEEMNYEYVIRLCDLYLFVCCKKCKKLHKGYFMAKGNLNTKPIEKEYDRLIKIANDNYRAMRKTINKLICVDCGGQLK